jgi:hypothetical protein
MKNNIIAIKKNIYIEKEISAKELIVFAKRVNFLVSEIEAQQRFWYYLAFYEYQSIYTFKKTNKRMVFFGF